MKKFDNTLRVSSGTIRITDQWTKVRASYWYDPANFPMAVFAQPIYGSGTSAVIRLRNVSGVSFEIRAESPVGAAVDIYATWLAMPQGVWDLGDGTRVEVQTVDSTQLDRLGSFVGQPLSYLQSYADPVVIGQVQTANDGWSAFWASGATSASIPSPSTLRVGRHVGGDTGRTHVAETLAVAVIEAGSHEINGLVIHAGRTGAVVPGWDSAPGNVHTQALAQRSQAMVASIAGMRGGDGCWPVVYSDQFAAVGTSAPLVVDEDTVEDAERGHMLEDLGFVAIDGRKDAARLLAQAGFGGNADTFDATYRVGVAAWLATQRALPQTVVTPYLDSLNDKAIAELGTNVGLSPEEQQAIRQQYPENLAFTNAASPHATNFSTAWMRNLLTGEDQLRQRIAHALGQIMVISGNGNLISAGASIGSYHDMLASHAFGNFRDLIRDVSKHPAMAFFLSSLGNQKASNDGSRQPDENYAREVMQLFTIGLWELNDDGTQVTDADDNPIPTYDNSDVTNLARIFTGLWYQGAGFNSGTAVRTRQGIAPRAPLAMFASQHDSGPKTLFAGKPWQFDSDGAVDGMTEIDNALDALVDHPNTGPFIAKRLIQFLVTSNPSPGYVRRVANAFADNGAGVRGDLFATVRQTLLDIEARGWYPQVTTYGKMQEPMVRIAQFARAFDAGANLQPDDVYFWRWPGAMDLGQWPMFSPSVFNFFQPGHELGNDFRATGLLAPEMQILNPITAATVPNNFAVFIDDRIQLSRYEVTPEFTGDFTSLRSIAADTDALIDEVDLLLCRGQMGDATKSVLINALPGQNSIDGRVRTAVWIALVSPEGAVLR